MRRLILWDVDGTLLRTGGAGRHALEHAAAVAAGLDQVPHVVMSGKTDQQIIREILTAAGVPAERITRLLPRALSIAEETLENSLDRIRSEGTALPGVVEALTALGRTPGVRQTLVTGNLAPNARLKLRAFDLERFVDFEVGAYGSDHADRNRLVPLALERLRTKRGETYAPDEVWVVGDTEHDLACARAGTARCLLVGNGADGFATLCDLGADAVVEDFNDTERVLKILLG